MSLALLRIRWVRMARLGAHVMGYNHPRGVDRHHSGTGRRNYTLIDGATQTEARKSTW
jgi:hypothetical protein